MEGFEHLVKVTMETEGLIVTGNVKFHAYKETTSGKQKHGYEIDLVGARQDKLVLASVKSFFGSRGVTRLGFQGLHDKSIPLTARHRKAFSLFKVFNDQELRTTIIDEAANRYGYRPNQVELRLYAGRFRNEADRQDITDHLSEMVAGAGPVQVIGVEQVIARLMAVLNSKTYVNDPVVSTLKALAEAARRVSGEGKKHSAKRAIKLLQKQFGLYED